MTEPQRPAAHGNVSDELRPYVDHDEAAGIDRIAERLRTQRPFPRAAFRAELRAHLRGQASARPAWRPRHLRRLVVAYAGSGVALLAVAAIGLAGAGPLA
jgi:hypothetical protein